MNTKFAADSDCVYPITPLEIENLRKFRADFILARKDFKPIKKSLEGHYASYADYDIVYSAINDSLLRHGFSIHQPMKTSPNGNILMTKLCHIGGHEEVSEMLLPPSLEMFDIGGAITYFRRYQLVTLLGLPWEEKQAKPTQDVNPEDHPRQNNTKTQVHTLNKPFRFTGGQYGPDNGKPGSGTKNKGNPEGLTFDDISFPDLTGYIDYMKSPAQEKNMKYNEAAIHAFNAWLDQKNRERGHKDFDQPPPHDDKDYRS
jgi:hypothetical protein